MNRMATTNRLLGVLLLLLGFSAIAGGTFLMVKSSQVEITSKGNFAPLVKECETHARSLGFNGPIQMLDGGKSTGVKFAVDQGEASEALLAKSSALLLGCRGYELSSYCIGRGCGDDVLSLELKKTF